MKLRRRSARPARHARVTRRFTPRRWLPFVLLMAVVGSAVYVSDTFRPPNIGEVTVSAPETFLPVASVPDPVSSTWFCGGGTAVGASEREDLSFVISSAADRGVTAKVTVFGGGGKPRATTVDVPVNGRVRVRAREVRPGEWAAATVEVFGGVATVERQVDGPDDFEVSPCASVASNRWYLPSGSTLRGAVLRLALFNPFPDPTSVDVSFATDEGAIAPRALSGLAVPARSLRVVTVENPSRRAEVAATVTTRTGRIIVDRLQTYDGSGDPVTGSGPGAVDTEAPRGIASTPAVSTPSPAWFFPDVRIVQGGRTQLALLNPSAERAEVEVTFGFDDPRLNAPMDPIIFTLASRRQTLVDLTDRLAFSPGMELTMRVQTADDVGVVAELVWFTGDRDAQPEPSEGDPDAQAEVAPEDPPPGSDTTPPVSAPSASSGSTVPGAPDSITVPVAGSETTAAPTEDERVPEADPDADPEAESDPDAELAVTVYAPGYAVTAGAPVAARSWFLAGRGTSSVITSEVIVANPSARAVKVRVQELVGGARRSRPGAGVTVPAGGRAKLVLDEVADSSALIISGDGPLVVGRTQWATNGRGISTDLATPFPDQVVPLPPG